MSHHALLFLLDGIIFIVTGGSIGIVLGTILRPSMAGPNAWMAWVMAALGIAWYFWVYR
jgi:hypothetical protein